MSKLRGANVSDEHIRQYIKTQAAKKGEGSDVSVEHLRKTFGIGYKRAKRLHDDELGPTNPDAYRSGRKATPKRDDAVSDEAAMEFIQKCRDEGRDISTNELRHELHIGYKRAVRLLTQGDQPVRTSTRSPTSKKRTSMTLGPINLGFGEGDAANAIDELAGLHPISPNKRVRRERKSEEVDESEEGEEDEGSRDDDEGLEEAKALETLDEGRVVDTNGDGLLEFTDVVLNLPKGVGWDTLQAFEYKEK